MIGIVDYGVGNILAFANMYKGMNIPYQVVDRKQDLSGVDRIILPGVGAFDFAIEKLNSSGLRDELDRAVLKDKLPVLGICVGMQMLGESSEEGELAGLNWIPGSVKKFSLKSLDTTIRLPHMGWNTLSVCRDTRLLYGLNDDARFYFLHSYYFACSDSEDELASCDYGGNFTCAVSRGNVYGVQFHPEKSHEFGAKLLRNFAEI